MPHDSATSEFLSIATKKRAPRTKSECGRAWGGFVPPARPRGATCACSTFHVTPLPPRFVRPHTGTEFIHSFSGYARTRTPPTRSVRDPLGRPPSPHRACTASLSNVLSIYLSTYGRTLAPTACHSARARAPSQNYRSLRSHDTSTTGRQPSVQIVARHAHCAAATTCISLTRSMRFQSAPSPRRASPAA